MVLQGLIGGGGVKGFRRVSGFDVSGWFRFWGFGGVGVYHCEELKFHTQIDFDRTSYGSTGLLVTLTLNPT